MSQQEFIEWALQDILIKIYDDVDLIVTGYVSSRECNSFTLDLINEALVRLIKEYDIVIFDCEYDLELGSASVTVGPGTAVALAAQASFPVAGQTSQASAWLSVSINPDGSFSGSATVKGLSLAGSPDVTLSGSVSGTPGANGDAISSQVQGTMAAISLPGLAGAELSNVTVGLGTGANAGLSFSGTLNGIAQMSPWPCPATSSAPPAGRLRQLPRWTAIR